MPLKFLDGFEMFPWNKSFDMGISHIDAQHKRLVGLLNQLGFYLGHRADSFQLNEIFDALAAYADYHFKAEEEVWSNFLKDDPWVINHQHIHSTFIVDVTELKKEVEGRSLDEAIEDILRFLSRWLVLHILGDDMRLAKVVHGIENGLNIEQAKVQADEIMKGEVSVLIETLLQMYDSMTIRTLRLMRNKA